MHLQISDTALSLAAINLAHAADDILVRSAEGAAVGSNVHAGAQRRDSLTGIEHELDAYLSGVTVACAALADAAKHASLSARELMREGEATDRLLAGLLYEGYAVAEAR